MITILVLILIVAHILGDFYLQWDYSCKNKQKQNPIFCKREGFVVTFFDNRNAIMDSHLGFKRMVACPVYNDITFSD